MDYFVIDLETANPNYASICQIGIVEVRGGQVLPGESILVDPEDFFDPYNVSIHGIDEAKVAGAPSFHRIYGELAERLSGNIVLHHGPFDRVALGRASQRYKLSPIDALWLDNQSVVRRAWPQFAKAGYGLQNLCQHFNLNFVHHDALEDARVTEIIFRKALTETSTSASDWLVRARERISDRLTSNKDRTGNASGRFYGQTILFTGEIGMPRSEAEALAQMAGFATASSMTKHVDLLVVGMQDATKLAGYTKSSKHRKAEDMQRNGHHVEIVSDVDFWAMMPTAAKPKIPTQRQKKSVAAAAGKSDLVIELSLESLFSDEELIEMFGE